MSAEVYLIKEFYNITLCIEGERLDYIFLGVYFWISIQKEVRMIWGKSKLWRMLISCIPVINQSINPSISQSVNINLNLNELQNVIFLKLQESSSHQTMTYKQSAIGHMKKNFAPLHWDVWYSAVSCFKYHSTSSEWSSCNEGKGE